METNPLAADVLMYLGPVPIDRAVVTTWAIMATLTLVSWLGLRHARVHARPFQTTLEIAVDLLSQQIGEIVHGDPRPYLPLLGTLFFFLLFANLSAVVPGFKPPTGHLETPAVLAAIVFLSVHYFGIRALGLRRYARRYIQPNVLMLPLNVLSELTRTFSLMIRLFGNIMSHEMVIAIVVSLAGLLVPIPFMLLGIMIGIIQAFIFTVLAAVFIGAGVSRIESS